MALINNTQLLENRSMAFVFTDLEGTIQQVSVGFLEFIGQTEARSLTQSSLRDFFVSTADYDQWQESINNLGGISGFETLFLDQDGEAIWVEIHTWLSSSEKGGLYQTLVVDITDRKQKYQEISENAEWHRAILDQCPLTFQIMNMEGKIIGINQIYHQIWNITLDDLKDYNARKDEVGRRLGILEYTERAFNGEVVTVPPTTWDDWQTVPRGRWFKIVLYPVFDENHSIRNVVLTHIDVTDLMEARERLNRRVAHLEALNSVNAVINGSVSITEGLESAITILMTQLHADGGNIYLYDEPRNIFTVLVHPGLSDQLMNDILAWEHMDEFQSMVVHSDQPFLEFDISQYPIEIPESLRVTNWNSLVTIPLTVKDRLVGIMNIYREEKGGFTADDLSLIKSVGDAIANAIENNRLSREVKIRSDELERLSSQALIALEAERKRISQELHDEMGQTLTAMRINIDSIENDLGEEISPAIQEKILESRSMVDSMLRQVRDLSLELRPPMLDDLGLLPTIRWLFKRFTKRMNMETELVIRGMDESLPSHVETVIYRVVQEALTNITKYAQATRVRVILEQDAFSIVASIEDNGLGFENHSYQHPEANRKGLGIIGMRERVQSIGGQFLIRTRPGGGTLVRVEIPIHKYSDSDDEKRE